MKKKWWIPVLVILLAGAGYLGYGIYSRSTENDAPDLALSGETTVVERGTLRVTVDATGNVAPEQEVALAFLSPGTVAEVLVEEGERVEAGQPLARLDTADLEDAVAQAQIALSQAQVQLRQTLNGPTDESIASMEAALDSARANYNSLLSGATTEELAKSAVALEQARIALESAQGAYDRAGGGWKAEADYGPQASQLWQAQAGYDKALSSYNALLEGASSTDLWAASARVKQAQANLDKLLNTPTSEDIALAELAVKTAEIALQQAQLNLKEATLAAPCAGIVTQVNVNVGEKATGTAIVIGDLETLVVEVLLDENDVAQLTVGQKAHITFDAFDDVEIGGEIVAIAPTADIQSGIVLYPVTVALDPTETPIRAGMTAEVEIVIANAENVLILPLTAIQEIDGRTFVLRQLREGESFEPPTLGGGGGPGSGQVPGAGAPAEAERQPGNREGRAFGGLSGFMPVPVTLGASSETHVAVSGALQEGDVVSLGNITKTTEQLGKDSPFPMRRMMQQ
ncbi:MAG: efflux RND transporter periplasmic adaptor subunit [Anaerolineae bacterium]|nr:efflux RND transporter periplasmic adaptor subunit [Anaerolineae bacterium]